MGINIGICELDAKNASCREFKMKVHKVKVDQCKGFEEFVEFDELVPLDTAKKLFPDWEAFMKRNRINAETDAIYLDKVKNADDLILLKKNSQKISTGWVSLDKLDPKLKDMAISASKPENRLTGWDLVEFDEMNEMCTKCALSWDKGRGCIGAFGPDNSLLPEIAKKHGCNIIASAPESAKVKKIFTPEDAKKMLIEVKKLNEVMPDEGKMMVRRYSGPLERLEAVAKISSSENCGFYFF
jgi:hypothetical protein